MTINQFCEKTDSRRSKVLDWIKRGYIPGADLEKDYIPDSARVPFTGARAKKATSIYASIIKAAINRKHVLPCLYRNLCEDEFYGYIDRLERYGLIEKRVTDGITYYDATPLTLNDKWNKVLQVIDTIVNAAAKGVAQGMQ